MNHRLAIHQEARSYLFHITGEKKRKITRGNKKKKQKGKQTTHHKAAVEGTEVRVTGSLDGFYLLVDLVPCYPVSHLLPAFFDCGFLTTIAPPLPIPLYTAPNGCVALSTQVRLILVPPGHEPFSGVEDSPVPLARLRCCNGPHRGLYSKYQRGMYRGPLGGSKHLAVFNKAFLPSLWLSSRSPSLPAGQRPEHHSTR